MRIESKTLELSVLILILVVKVQPVKKGRPKTMGVRETIIQKLNQVFEPEILEVTDNSERHRGHAGWREGGETHFHVKIGTSHLASQSRIAQHRAIMEALKSEFDAGLHALTIEIVGK